MSSDKIIEAEDLINFLYQRQSDSEHNLVMAATKLSEASFAKAWDNPEDAESANLIKNLAD